jgi:hypothetical protein
VFFPGICISPHFRRTCSLSLCFMLLSCLLTTGHQSFPARIEKGMVMILHHKEKAPLKIATSVTGGGALHISRGRDFAAQGCMSWYFYLHSQNFPFLGNHEPEQTSRMSLYRNAYNVSQVERMCLSRNHLVAAVCLTL